jgi:hypothetical protein
MLKRNKIELVVTLILLVACRNYIFGQSEMQDSVKCRNAISNTIALYTETVGVQAGIYNGCDYQYERINSGHVFFETNNLVKGSIVYNHIEYRDVPMLYDIVRDELVIQGNYQPYFILLASNKISQFSLSGHTFTRISADSLTGTAIQTGFYECLYNGKTKAWVKNRKVIDESIDNGNILKKTAVEKNKWFISKQGTYYEVQGKSSILKVLSDKKKEIQQFSKKNKIRFKDDMNNALAFIMAYYDKISIE